MPSTGKKDPKKSADDSAAGTFAEKVGQLLDTFPFPPSKQGQKSLETSVAKCKLWANRAWQSCDYGTYDLSSDSALLDAMAALCTNYPAENEIAINWALTAAMFIFKYKGTQPARCTNLLSEIEKTCEVFPNVEVLRAARDGARGQLSKDDYNTGENLSQLLLRGQRSILDLQSYEIEDLEVTRETLGIASTVLEFFLNKTYAKATNNFISFSNAFEGVSRRLKRSDREFIKDSFSKFDVIKSISSVSTLSSRIMRFLTNSQIFEKLDEETDEGCLQERDKTALDQLHTFLDLKNVPKFARAGLIRKFSIDIARATRPKWKERLQKGGDLATLSAPLFLKRVHFEEIGPDGTVENEIIRSIDPELMKTVEVYLSKRKQRGLDQGDAKGLNFALERPGNRQDPRAKKATL